MLIGSTLHRFRAWAGQWLQARAGQRLGGRPARLLLRLGQAAGVFPPGVGVPAILARKYAEIAELTRPACLGACPQAGACCAPLYCALAEQRAEDFGVLLPAQQVAEPAGNGGGADPRTVLKFMGPTGCVVPPHLRPLCAVHVCEAQLLNESDFSRAYFSLREEVCALEERLGPGWPHGLSRNYWE